MASDIKNVKLGVCKIYFGGVDLGYTKGGVEVSVKTDTHKVNVDQFGKTPVNEYIMGREVSVKAPLAETTLPNMVQVMPGAVLVQTGGAAASGTITFGSNPSDGQTIVLGGKTITFKSSGAVASSYQVTLGASASATAAALAAFLNSITDATLNAVTASANAAVVTLTAANKGSAGNNSLTIAAGTSGVTFVGMAGGVDGTSARVDVPTGIGTNLLDKAQQLVLHPVSKADDDKSDDFVVYRAATAGSLNFAYKLEDERVFNCEFNGYPDPQGRLFGVGDLAAI